MVTEEVDVLFRDFATCPCCSDAVWCLTQMWRRGRIVEPKSDAWYLETAREVYRPDIHATAAKELIEEGRMSAGERPDPDPENGFRPPRAGLGETVELDGRELDACLRQLAIGRKEEHPARDRGLGTPARATRPACRLRRPSTGPGRSHRSATTANRGRSLRHKNIRCFV